MAGQGGGARRVWITGASSGIGRALALELARHGDRVAVSARGAAALADVATEAGGEVAPFPVDVTDAAAVEAAVAAIEAGGPLDLAVLNAGIHSPVEPRQGFPPETFRRLFEVNVMGVVNGIAAVLPRFLARRRGRIVIVSSVAGYRGLPTAAAYGATKAALINLAESLKLDLDGTGVEVQLVCPGFVATPATERNPFPMPFLMPAEAAAARIRRGLAGRRFEVTFPRRFTWQLKLLSMLPYGAYFRIVHRFTGR